MQNTAGIADAIARATGAAFLPDTPRPLAGGCINQTFALSDGKRRFFVKTNRADHLSMFEAEAAGLEAILAAQAIRAPHPVCFGVAGRQAFLALEYLDLNGRNNDVLLGRQLAQQHRNTVAQFGWARDNTIGSTPQCNAWTDDWVTFVSEQRLSYQLRLAQENGLGKQLVSQGEKLIQCLAGFFSGYCPAASLLHGDLWGGNVAFTPTGEPVVFDPAVYYGDREADLAMTELFGGFGKDFYAAYREAWPLDPGYATRKTLYNLYHILNHANLFGGTYPAQADSMIQRLLAACK